MGEKIIATQVKIDGDIVPDFSYDWEVEFRGEKYVMPLRLPQGSKGNESLSSTIDLSFQHWAVRELKRYPFVTIQQVAAGTYLPDEEVATVQLNLKDFCILFGQVLEYYYGDAITIDLNPEWLYKQEATIITISHTKIWNVLVETLHDKYGVRWAIEAAEGNSNTEKGGERYVIKVGYPTSEIDHIFEYGFDGGLLKIERQVQSDDIRNVIKGRGGDKNIPRYYFKKSPDEEQWHSDPDWVAELKNIFFTNLMPATFRSYIQGWKAAHINDTDESGAKLYPGYTAAGESDAYAPWAYRKGYTDTKFAPVEFVADEITIAPAAGDRQVEILPGYSPYVKKGSSLDKYGPLFDTLDNNADIYPTIQGTGMDIAVAVEQIQSDDVVQSVENDAQIADYEGYAASLKRDFYHGDSATFQIIVDGGAIHVPEGKYADLQIINADVKATYVNTILWRVPKPLSPGDYEMVSYEAEVFDTDGEQLPSTEIPEGDYTYRVVFNVRFKGMPSIVINHTFTASYGGAKLSYSSPAGDKWNNTFHLWVKNIWNTAKLADETDAEYAQRVWRPILGDREKNTAKVVFTSGALVHEDYEFTIVGFPAPDTSKTWEQKNDNGTVVATHDSHWRITLAKSDAELKATGLYVPSTQKQGKAGDTFAFIGTEMTHHYTLWGEEALDDWKKDQLREKKESKPTYVVTPDRVKFGQSDIPDENEKSYLLMEDGGHMLMEDGGEIITEGSGFTSLLSLVHVGDTLRLADKRFVAAEGQAYELLTVQSLTYTFREPTSDDAALNPDIAIILGDGHAVGGTTVASMQGEITALQRQIGSISNVEQIVRAIGDKLYLRKDGISDRSLSPTQFFSLLTGGNFRAGIVGGAGWGFYRDDNGSWVLETDKINVRQDLQVNTLVINQAMGRRGMEIDTAAMLEVTRVEETETAYVCYFDQKDGSVANAFRVGDVAYSNRWTPDDAQLKFYKRRVTAVSNDSVTLTKALNGAQRPATWPDSGVNGFGAPTEGDIIIHFGNYTDQTRQYVKVRDVVGGGYESYIEGLDSVNADGTEYYFVGRRAGESYRWFIGDINGEYIEWKDGKLHINGSLTVGSTVDGKPIGEYVSGVVEETGAVITDKKVEYAASAQGAAAPASGWQTDIPTVAAGNYLWTRTTLTYSDGTTTQAYSVSRVGENGVGYAPNLISGREVNIVAPPTSTHVYKAFLLEQRVYGVGEKFTISADKIETLVGTTETYGVTLYKRMADGTGGEWVAQGTLTQAKRYATLALNSEVPADMKLFLYVYAGAPGQTAGNKVRYTHLMLCEGDTPRPWVPSAEEMEGVTVASQTVRYAVTLTGGQPADSNFIYTSVPPIVQGQYLWTRVLLTYSDGTEVKSYTVGRAGTDGTNGLPGAAGADGKTSYVHFAYASGITGTLPHPTAVTGFSTVSFPGARYIGVCTDFNEADPTDAALYEWSLWGVSEGGGVNLLRNTDYLDGLEHWAKNADVTVSDTYMLEGRPSAHMRYDGGTNDWRLYMNQEVAVAEDWKGKPFTLSAYVRSDSGMVSANAPVSMEMRFLDSSGNRISTHTAAVPATQDGLWHRLSASGTCPANAVKIAAVVVAQNNAELLVNGMKLEMGNTATQWSASPMDASYLRSAFRESTTMDRGLVVATLLKLGYTAEDGEYKVMAGVNGAANVTGPRDIAFWAGGEAVDAANAGGKTPATYVVRHDGTVYACGNTVRFEANRMEIGDNLELNERGLFLKGSDGAVRLRITNEEVWDGVTGTSSFKNLNKTYAATAVIGKAGNSGTGGISATPRHYIKGQIWFPDYTFDGTIAAGSTVTGTVSLAFTLNGDFANQPMTATAIATIMRKNGAAWVNVYRQEASFITSGNRHTCNISLNASLAEEGTYMLRVTIPATKGGSGDPTETANITGSMSGKVILGVDEQTVVGNNGMMTIWNGMKFVTSRKNGNGYFGVLVGNYGLQITADGFKKTINGGASWLPVDLPTI